MAVEQNQLVEYSDLSDYYTSFNTFIQNYTNGTISTVVLPPIDSNVQPSDLTNLNTKIDSFQSDEFLGTESSLWIKATPPPTVGGLLLATTWENIKTTVTNMGLVQCRNRANNTYGTVACNPQSCGGQGTCSKTCSNGSHGNTCSNGSHGNNCSNGKHSNGNYYFSCAYSGYSVAGTGSGTNATASGRILKAQVTCTRITGCTVCSQGETMLRVVDSSCGYSTWTYHCGVTCSYGARSVSCSNGTRSVSCSNGTRSVSCNYSSNSNSSCNNGTKTCTAQGTTIDIRNAQATITKS